jgi:hypothetical protein
MDDRDSFNGWARILAIGVIIVLLAILAAFIQNAMQITREGNVDISIKNLDQKIEHIRMLLEKGR